MKTAPLAIVVLEREVPRRIEMGNILLQAVEEGLGADWMGVMPGTENEMTMRRVLNLPENVKPFSVIGIGYSAGDADLEAVGRYDATRIHFNRY